MILNYIRNIDELNSIFETGIGEFLFKTLSFIFFLVFKYIEFLSVILCLYTFFLMLISVKKKPKKYKNHDPYFRFLVLIPAHNEGKVIKNIINNILNDINYPKNLLELYVIADNCNDNTIEICKDMNVNVIEHISSPEEPKGKPYGIEYAIKKLNNKLDDFDFISIFDADNIISENFFDEINSQLKSDKEIKVVQAYLDCKNIDESYISLGYSLSYYLTNRFFCYARDLLNIFSVIGGTGFVMSTNVIKDIGWNVTSLTEDLELQMQCILKDYRIAWNHYTCVYDEKPTKIKQSFVQRFRWARGHWTVKKKYFRKLIIKFINDLFLKQKLSLSCLDGALYSISPLISSMTIILLFYKIILCSELFHVFIILGVIIFISFIYSLLALYAMKNDSKVKTNSSLLYIFISNLWYVITGIFIYGIGILTYNKNVWIRTEHTSNKNIEDILVVYKKKY